MMSRYIVYGAPDSLSDIEKRLSPDYRVVVIQCTTSPSLDDIEHPKAVGEIISAWSALTIGALCCGLLVSLVATVAMAMP